MRALLAGMRPRERWAAATTVGCYALGYPLALWGPATAGWVLVALGGPFLLILVVLVIGRVRSST